MSDSEGYEISIELARAGDGPNLSEIERRAAVLFSREDVSPVLAENPTVPTVYEEALEEGLVLVARGKGDRIFGFAHLVWLDGRIHLEELDVDPRWGRRGIGRRLVEAAIEKARSLGSDRVTLSTFRDVAWNGPFYSQLGFRPLSESQLSEGLKNLREHEAREGLDPKKRIMMCRRLDED